jgi:hypothetical protein
MILVLLQEMGCVLPLGNMYLKVIMGLVIDGRQ